MTELFHPFAAIFPLMSGQEYDALVEDVRQNGIREPIWLDRDGRIIDGRNRWRACLDLGLDCPANTYVGSDDDLLALVVSMNLHRRHLNESQRAMVAANLANMQSGARTDLAKIFARSDAQAAKLLNVSERSVETAKAVKRGGTHDLVKLVEQGELAVSAAADIAKLPVAEQDELVARGEVEILAKAKEIRAQRQGEKRIARRAMAETKAANAGPLPADRTFCVLYADPPWTFETYSDLGKDRSAENHYPTMTLQQICDLPVPRCAAEDAVLFLWATSPNLEQAFEVIKYWGFSYNSSLVWVKKSSRDRILDPQSTRISSDRHSGRYSRA
jgi:ParB-like chromosome segregation protein Spo0J